MVGERRERMTPAAWKEHSKVFDTGMEKLVMASEFNRMTYGGGGGGVT